MQRNDSKSRRRLSATGARIEVVAVAVALPVAVRVKVRAGRAVDPAHRLQTRHSVSLLLPACSVQLTLCHGTGGGQALEAGTERLHVSANSCSRGSPQGGQLQGTSVWV